MGILFKLDYGLRTLKGIRDRNDKSVDWMAFFSWAIIALAIIYFAPIVFNIFTR